MWMNNEKTYDVRSLAKMLSTSAACQIVDPDIACIPAHVPHRGAALLIAMESEALNARGLDHERTLDPVVIIYCYTHPHCPRIKTVSIPMSKVSLLCSAQDSIVGELRKIAGIRDPNVRTRPAPYRHAV